ncbi:uncharacterized protein [Fopius arisanus]|uniref:Uncharacterized protein n=3 Tax=Fopius arisanus TaxID=64838 RepID=A0A9R1T3A0_9HYME|nr:PREDICTED: uncharacterized protein LOC105265869 [Fopius arisanus]
MWHVIGITVVFLVSQSVEGSQDVYLSNNEKQKMINRLDAMKMGLSLVPHDAIPKGLKESLRHLQRRSILKMDFRDGPIMHRLSSRSPEFARWAFWPDIESDKIISSMEQHRNHALVLQEGRNPSFSPWGGKRDSSAYKPDPKIRRPARVPFNSWGGKRDGEHTGVIKKPFNSWGGKRSLLIGDILRAPTGDISRNSWRHSVIDNPKLVTLDPHDFPMNDFDEMEKKEFKPEGMSINNNMPRVPFGPWGGRKRQSDESSENYMSVSPSSSYVDSE